ncbi:unnamed protein product [Prunus armeniaca]|uniref:SWIM-type domain-containing protein n=1 Tax=Prunus armeniaca TaxID=36596 RepID=A0A6J5U9T9_PRUAR|nr:unnamed protein product [Prunus armeniaca]
MQLYMQWSSGPKYQVDAGRGDQYVVDLDNHTCSCRKWDLSGIPCAHGIATIHYKGGTLVEDYVHSYYSKDSYMTLYNNLIMPINGSQLWEKTNQTAIKPLAYTRQPGRLRKEKPLSKGKGRPRKIPNQDPAVASQTATRARRKLAYVRAKATAATKKAALNASQSNVANTARINWIEIIQRT